MSQLIYQYLLDMKDNLHWHFLGNLEGGKQPKEKTVLLTA